MTVTVHIACHAKKCGVTYEQRIERYGKGYYPPPSICGACGGRFITITNIHVEEN